MKIKILILSLLYAFTSFSENIPTDLNQEVAKEIIELSAPIKVIEVEQSLAERMTGFLGLGFILLLAYFLSENK